MAARRAALQGVRLLAGTSTLAASRAAAVAPVITGAVSSASTYSFKRDLSVPSPSRGFASSVEDDYWSNQVIYPETQAEVGSPAPGFSAPAVVDGEIKNISLDDYKGKYVCLFFYPKDFTFVCPTEIIAFSDRAKEFEELNCQLIAASTDTPEVHLAWIKTPRKRGGLGYMQIPILADVQKEIAARYGVLKRDAGVALRGLYIINPEGVLEHVTINNFPIGRNVDEAKRVLQAVQFVAEHGEVCPAGWKPGDKTMVADPDKSLDYFENVDAEKGEPDYERNLTKIGSKKDWESLLSSGKKVVLKAWAPWCGKCNMIAPYVSELQEKYPGVAFASLDTTDERVEGLAAELGVKTLPNFRFYKDGQEVMDKIIGYKKAPLAEAVKKLDAM